MLRLRPYMAITLLLACATPLFAGHSDIVVELDGNQLVTINDSTGEATRVYVGELGELSVPGFTDDPGYASDVLAPDSLLGYNVAQSLLFWNGEAFVTPPEDESLDISITGTTVTTVTGTSGYQDGAYFGQAGANGALHQHIGYWVKHPTFDEGNPFVNPISDGAYVLVLELTSSVHETSEPFAIVFNNNLTPEEIEAAVEAAGGLFEPACPGDLDGDLDVDLSDLAQLLAHYGTPSGATYEEGDLDGDGDVDLSDLAALLAVYGTVC